MSLKAETMTGPSGGDALHKSSKRSVEGSFPQSFGVRARLDHVAKLGSEDVSSVISRTKTLARQGS